MKEILEPNITFFDLLMKDIPNIDEYIKKPKIVISDCDGILNDGKMHTTRDCKLFKSYGCHDKEMIKFYLQLGWNFLFVTNDMSGYDITRQRLRDSINLGYANGISLKQRDDVQRKKLIEFYKENNYFVIFCGDSMSDIPSLSLADLSGTTNNAFPPVKRYCDYVSKMNGGEGGFADILYNLLPETY